MSGTSKIEEAVLEANATFYRAFSQGDYAAMSLLWAARTPIACFHPGSVVLLGRDAVLGSWRQILRGKPPFELRCDRACVSLLTEAAIVCGYEGNDEHPAHLAATNVFVLEDGDWRLVHHQAGPLSVPLPKPVSASFVN